MILWAVMPAKAGIHDRPTHKRYCVWYRPKAETGNYRIFCLPWMPAFAGMTVTNTYPSPRSRFTARQPMSLRKNPPGQLIIASA